MRSFYSLVLVIVLGGISNAQTGGGSEFCGKLGDLFHRCSGADGNIPAPNARSCTGDCLANQTSCAESLQNIEVKVFAAWDEPFNSFVSLPPSDSTRKPYKKEPVVCVTYTPCTAPCEKYTKPDGTKARKCVPDVNNASGFTSFNMYTRNGFLCADAAPPE